jgi:hypothetical protein
MRRLYECHWLDLPYSAVPVQTSLDRLAGADFYRAFYAARAGLPLPPEFIARKRAQADWLNARWPRGRRVVSVGAGLGLIEERLAEHGHDIVALDPAPAPERRTHARLEWRAGYFPDAVADRPAVDIILCADLLSALTDEEAIALFGACAMFPAAAVWAGGDQIDSSRLLARWRVFRVARRMRRTPGAWQLMGIGRTRSELIHLIARAGLRMMAGEWLNRWEYWIAAAPARPST